MVRSNRLSQRSLLATMALCMVLLSLQLTSPTSAAAPKSSQTPSHSAISGPEAVARAKTWVDAKVPYNQHAFNSDGYREDCVGLVSMAWGVPAPGMGNTISVLKNYVTQISPNDLQPGDALLNAYGGARPADWQHIILFAGWVNQNDHSAGYNGYEESPYYNGAHYSTNVPFPYYGGFDTNDYIAVRYNNIVDKNQPAFYANKIVQWKDPAKTQLIAWLVTPDLKRLWIPDSATFYCLTGEGVEVAGVLSSTLLDKLPDLTGRSVLCGSMQPVSAKLTPTPTTPPAVGPTPTTPPVVVPTHTPTSPPAPAPSKSVQIGWSSAHPTWIWMTFNGFAPGTYTYACTFSTPPQSVPFTIVETTEPQTWDNGKTCYDTQAGDHVWVVVNGVSSNTLTVGSSSPPPLPTVPETAGPNGSGTFTDYTNAGGTVGQRVAAYQTIQVTCRLTGWTAPDGDNWWYRLPAIAPWNSSVFYAPADNFYNNGQTSGSLKGTPLYDPNVPLC